MVNISYSRPCNNHPNWTLQWTVHEHISTPSTTNPCPCALGKGGGLKLVSSSPSNKGEKKRWSEEHQASGFLSRITLSLDNLGHGVIEFGHLAFPLLKNCWIFWRSWESCNSNPPNPPTRFVRAEYIWLAPNQFFRDVPIHTCTYMYVNIIYIYKDIYIYVLNWKVHSPNATPPPQPKVLLKYTYILYIQFNIYIYIFVSRRVFQGPVENCIKWSVSCENGSFFKTT